MEIKKFQITLFAGKQNKFSKTNSTMVAWYNVVKKSVITIVLVLTKCQH